MKIKVGTKVFMKPTGNAANHYKGQIQEGEITKVGRKYFYVEDRKYDIQTLEYTTRDSTSGWIIYSTKQEILDEKEKEVLLDKLRDFFDWSGKAQELSLENLKDMAKIAKLL